MSVQLFIEDNPVDLTGEENITVDYAIAKIGDIQSRTGARSVQFSLPKTARNRTVLQNPDDVNSLTTVPYRKLKARLYADGIDQLITMCTLEESGDTYNCRLYGNEVGFFDKLKDAELRSLNLSHLDYFHTYDNVAAKRGGTDVCFPITWNFEPGEAFEIGDTRYMPCALGVEHVLEQICLQQGYTLKNPVKEQYGFPARVLCMPFTNDSWTRGNNGSFYHAELSATTSTPNSGRYIILFNTVVNQAANYYNNISSWNNVLFFADEIDVTFTATIQFTPGVGYTNPLKVGLVIDGIQQPGQNYYLSPGSNTITFNSTVSLTPNYASLVNIVSVFYECTGAVTMAPTARLVISNAIIKKPYPVLREHSVLSTGGPVLVYSAQYVSAAAMLPDMSQAELLKAYCQLFCALINVNEARKEVELVLFNDIAAGVNASIDWSDKLDFSSVPSVKYVPDKYARNSRFVWNYDMESEDGLPSNAGFADGELLIDNDNIPATAEVVALKFCATEMIEAEGHTVCHISSFNSDGLPSGKSKPRLVFIEYQNGTLTYKDSDDYTVATDNLPFTYFIKSTSAHNLGFNNSLLSKYYNQFKGVLDNYKQVECKLRLNAADINRLDFTRPVYIKHFNAYFYINTVKGYSPMQPGSTTVELIKLF